MHRWFFANDRELCIKPEDSPPSEAEKQDEVKEEAERPESVWLFAVENDRKLAPNEHMALTGSCDSLGNWALQNVVLLVREPRSYRYTASILIPRDKDIRYRYLVCAINPHNEVIIARRWETHMPPRIIRTCSNMLKDVDIFGYYNDERKVDRAWLTTETLVLFKVFNAPFTFPNDCNERELYVKVTPKYPIVPRECQTPRNLRFRRKVSLSIVSNQLAESDNCEDAALCTDFAFAEVSTINCEQNTIRDQPLFGTRCSAEDVVQFHLTIGNVQATIYQFDLYTFGYKAADDEPPYYYGYGYVYPEQLVNSVGSVKIEMFCASTHRSVCFLNVDYLIVRPMPDNDFNMKTTYIRYWNRKHRGIDCGHRGCGKTYRNGDNVIRENTIYSFKRAAEHGADFIEFDVMVSKDMKPIVYHDYMIHIALKQCLEFKELMQLHDILVFPMNKFSLEQLRNLPGSIRNRHCLSIPVAALTHEQLSNVMAYQFAGGQEQDWRCSCTEMVTSQLPFPLLEDTLKNGPNIAYNIEIKYPQKFINKRIESGYNPLHDLNEFVDAVLAVILQHGGTKRIALSSFHPDVCIMLRFKQNRYPVMLVTLYKPNCSAIYLDPRTGVFPNCAWFTHAMELLGTASNGQMVLSEPFWVNFLLERGMIMFCWGSNNVNPDTRKTIMNYGVAGVIFDRIDSLNSEGKNTISNLYFLENSRNEAILKAIYNGELDKRCKREPVASISDFYR